VTITPETISASGLDEPTENYTPVNGCGPSVGEPPQPRWMADFTKEHESALSGVTSFSFKFTLVPGSDDTLGTFTANTGIPTTNNLEVDETTTITVTETPCIVPGVANESQASAASDLEDAGCTVGAVTQAKSSTVAIGNVISSAPAEGTRLQPLAPVALVVSKGSKVTVKCKVPAVKGLPLSAATTALKGANCAAGKVTKKASSTVKSGDVISTSPAAGATVASGAKVALTVSKGKSSSSSGKKCKVPNVVGKSEAAAKTALRKANCAVGKVTKKASSTVKSGKVISSSPHAGVTKPKGTKVALTVSSGKPSSSGSKCTVPNVKGKALAAAKNAIKAAHCAVGTVTQKASSTVKKGDVISTTPGAGAVKPKGTKVAITVSAGPNYKVPPPKR
jgi:beta-lactam-binding protein with PASTA domain